MQWFSNLAIGRKLAIGFGTLGVLICVVGALGWRAAQQIHAVVEEIHLQHATPALQLKEANVQLLRITRAVRNAILDDTEEAMARRAADIVVYDSAFRAEFAAYRSRIVHQEQRQMASRLLDRFDRLRPQQDEIVALTRSGQNAEAKARLAITRPQADTLDALMDTLITAKMTLMQEASQAGDRTYSRAIWMLNVLVPLAIVIAHRSLAGRARSVGRRPRRR